MNRDQVYGYAEAKVAAEHKGGRLLAVIEREPRKRTNLSGRHGVSQTTIYQKTLDDVDLEIKTAQRWQIMALVPADELQAYFIEQRKKIFSQ